MGGKGRRQRGKGGEGRVEVGRRQGEGREREGWGGEKRRDEQHPVQEG